MPFALCSWFALQQGLCKDISVMCHYKYGNDDSPLLPFSPSTPVHSLSLSLVPHFRSHVSYIDI